MNENMKLNAIATLMKSLEFNRQDKMALMEMLKQELYSEESKKKVEIKEVGPKHEFPMLYEDGVVSHYLRHGEWPVGVIVERKGIFHAKQIIPKRQQRRLSQEDTRSLFHLSKKH